MSLAQALIGYAQSGGKNDSALYRALAQRDEAPRFAPVPSSGSSGASFQGMSAPAYSGQGRLTLPTQWKGTHVTSGLGWGTKTAADIMARAGTPVGAPEPGVVEYFHPTGAQGGGSMLFDPVAPGPDYWIGHIAQGLPAGTRIRRRGQRIAVISPDHAAPHAHVDRGG